MLPYDMSLILFIRCRRKWLYLSRVFSYYSLFRLTFDREYTKVNTLKILYTLFWYIVITYLCKHPPHKKLNVRKVSTLLKRTFFIRFLNPQPSSHQTA